jgi:hypothetical protein
VKENSVFYVLYFTNQVKTAPADVLTVSPLTGAEPAF